MRKLTFFLLSLFFTFSNLFAAHSNFTAYLTGNQEVPAVITGATGSAAITLTAAGGIIYTITVNGLSGPITGAHFHLGTLKQAGPVIFPITSSFNGNTAFGNIAAPIADTIIAAFLTGKMYVNVHTAANPGGEIRGQVMLSSGTHLIARLDGTQEFPSVTTSAKGIAALTLTSAGGIGLAYNISVNGLSGPITGSHFHYAYIGETGPVVYDITPTYNGNNASGVWKTTGSNALSDSLILALLTGRLYINIHTAANPGGEIRGQVMLASGFGINANLDGASEVPPVITNAKGSAELTFTDYGLIYRLTVDGLSGPITGAHFHDADSGIAGPVVFAITSSISNNTAIGVWKASSTTGDLTPVLMKELFNNGLYVNVHTAANPSGEIRGQCKMKSGSGIAAYLTGKQETPPVTTTASGTAALYTVPTGLQYFITVNGLSGPITGAHFHYGSIREPGPVVKAITSSFTGNTASGIWGISDPTPFNDSLRQALVNGKLYLNVHTAANPGGEIRGQVFLSAGTGMINMMDGLQEVPSVTTTAKGTGSFTLTRGGLGFNISFSGLSGPVTGSHFHYGYPGVAGPVIKDITPNVNGNNITGYWKEVVTVDSLYNALLNGRLYVNIHTAANPSGEIRGQVFITEGAGLTIQHDGSQETPPVTTTARGSGSATITDAGIVFITTFTGLSGAPTGTHFHNAPAGSPGPVVRDLAGNLTGNNLIGAWKRTETSSAITNAFIAEAYNQLLYMNIHTSANPSGEIRGQLRTGALNPIGIQMISSEVPLRFSLSQNYPNPFNPVTKIKFAVPLSSQIQLKLYDILGREVDVLVNNELKPGVYEVSYNASKLASGVYFYKLSTGEFTDTKKMLLVK